LTNESFRAAHVYSTAWIWLA